MSWCPAKGCKYRGHPINKVIDALGLTGEIIEGKDQIVVLDKTYPDSQVESYTYKDSNGKGKCNYEWRVTLNHLDVVGSKYGVSIKVKPTSESANYGDAEIRLYAITGKRLTEKRLLLLDRNGL